MTPIHNSTTPDASAAHIKTAPRTEPIAMMNSGTDEEGNRSAMGPETMRAKIPMNPINPTVNPAPWTLNPKRLIEYKGRYRTIADIPVPIRIA